MNQKGGLSKGESKESGEDKQILEESVERVNTKTKQTRPLPEPFAGSRRVVRWQIELESRLDLIIHSKEDCMEIPRRPSGILAPGK